MGNLTSTDMISVYHRCEVVPAVLVAAGVLLILSLVPAITACCVSRFNTEKSTCELYYEFWVKCVTNIFSLAVSEEAESVNFAGITFHGDQKRCWNICGIVYFVVMLFWAIVWFWVIFWDNVLYSKLTRCVDINPQDDSITCFYISNNSRAHCTEISQNGQVANVICYALNRGQALNAAGIAFGFSQIVIYGVQIYFVAATRTSHWLIERKSASKHIYLWTIARITLVAIIPALLVVIAMVVWPAVSVENRDDRLIFFYGMEPLRWTQYGLGCLTLFSALLIPSCCATNSD